MWPGPYGDWGGRKSLLASLDQSLKRMGLDYVDIFYSHRPDPDTPLEETMGALDSAVRQGKALYVGVSSYNSRRTKEAAAILRRLGTPCLIHQPSYSMINRWIEDDRLLDTLEQEGVGAIVFSPLAQGLLTDKYLNGVPEGSRATASRFFNKAMLTPKNIERARQLDAIAQAARPDAGPDGAGVDAEGQARDVGADRSEQPRAGDRQRQGARQPFVRRRGTRRRSTATQSRAASTYGASPRSSAPEAPEVLRRRSDEGIEVALTRRFPHPGFSTRERRSQHEQSARASASSARRTWI